MNLHDIVKKGSTSRSVTLRIINSTTGVPETTVAYNTAGIDLWYRREGGAVVSITEATLATLTSAWSAGGFLAIANGEYRLDLPDAAFAAGANYVDFGGTVTGMIVVGGRVRLVDVDLEDTVRAGLTSLPNAVAGANGGLPTVDATNSVKIQTGQKKNQALANVRFQMFDATTNNPVSGKTVTATRAIDAGTHSAGTLSAVTEIANGEYRIDMGAGDRNGNVIALRLTAAGCHDQVIYMFMEP